MGWLVSTVCLLVAAAQLQDSGRPTLEVDELVEGVIEEGDPEVHTRALDRIDTTAPIVGRTYVIEVEESGPYYVELSSWLFDAYLVLRNAEGEVIAEDDDGLLGTHSRIVVPELSSGASYRLDACALHGARGPFELVLRRGAPATMSSRARAEAEIADHAERVRVVEEVAGAESLELARALNAYGVALRRRGRYADARPLYERALAIREKVLGPDHPATASVINNLAVLLKTQGDFAGARPLYERALAIRMEALGLEHPATATSMSTLALLLQAQGDLTGARPLQEQALAIRERVLGPTHPTTATSVRLLASLLEAQGDLAGARQLRERALAILEDVFGPDHVKIAPPLSDLAQSSALAGDLAAARTLYERALAIIERDLGPAHPSTAASLNNVARVAKRQGDLDLAQELYERALAINEQVLGPDHPATATNLSNLAAVYAARGDRVRARELHEAALAIQEEVLGPAHLDTAVSLNNLATLLLAQGDFAGALPLAERALEISEQVAGPTHRTTAQFLGNLAAMHEAQGDPAAARHYYERALEIRESTLGSEHPETAVSMVNLALVLALQGNAAEARALYERALEIQEEALGPDDPETARTLHQLASVLRSEGELSRAQALHERALKIREEVLGPEHPRTATSLNGLALLLKAQGDLEGARRLYERALAICEKAHGARHPETATSLHNLALLLQAQGDLASASARLERALAIDEGVLGAEHPDTLSTLNRLAMLLADQGELERGRELALRSSPGRRSQVGRMLTALTESESFQYLATLRWQLEVAQGLCDSADPKVVADGYEAVLGWKGRIGRALAESRARLMRDLSAEQRSLLERLRSVQAELSRLLHEDVSEERLLALGRERTDLELRLARPLERSGRDPYTSLDALRAALPERGVAVDFLVHRLYRPGRCERGELVEKGRFSEEHLTAWVVRPTGEVPALVRVDLGPADAVETATRAFLEELVGRRGLDTSVADEPDRSSELRRVLWEPLGIDPADFDTVFVSPDSFLGTLPFETLTLADGTFLIEHARFVYLPDATSLARRGPRPSLRRGGSLLAVGAIDFQAGEVVDRDGEDSDSTFAAPPQRGSFTDFWTPLRFTGYEVDSVEALHAATFAEQHARLVLRDSEPTEERLKRALPEHEIVLIATHGFFQPEGTPSMWESALAEGGGVDVRMRQQSEFLVGKHPGLLSGLVCAGANRPGAEGREDGYLTAEEVSWLDLDDVQLVVLSACETALGRARSGEGMMGLRRAFQTAGAQTVVSSLWSVRDRSTADLVRDFHANLWLEGMGRVEALRQAQLAMLRRNRIEKRDPLPSTWGAFVLSGEWR